MQLAQLNIGKTRSPLESPEMAEFVNNLEPVNAIAESSPGFIWRLKDESGDATNIEVIGYPDIIVNLSVWQDLASLRHFMFRTHHSEFLGRRKEWFVPMEQDSYVLWWVPDNHIPDMDEAFSRLELLRQQGPTPLAFNFKRHFSEHDAKGASASVSKL